MLRLKQLRDQRNLTQAEVAKAINISRQSYNFYENEQREMGTDTMKALAAFYGVTIDYLLGENNSAELPPELAKHQEKIDKLNALFNEMTPEQQQLLISLAENMRGAK